MLAVKQVWIVQRPCQEEAWKRFRPWGTASLGINQLPGSPQPNMLLTGDIMGTTCRGVTAMLQLQTDKAFHEPNLISQEANSVRALYGTCDRMHL